MPKLPLPSLLVLVALLPAAPVPAPAQELRPDAGQVARLVVEQTNALRRAEGAGPTAVNAALAATAQQFADYMARTDRYGHEADGRQPADRATAQGYAYCLVAENLAWQSSSAGFATADLAQRLVEGWKRSPPHRHNMLEPDATETGVALAHSARTGRWYAVQMFGRPQSMRISFRIANQSATPLRYVLGSTRYQLPPRVTRTHEQCRAEVLTLQLPGDDAPLRLEPRAGERIGIERAGTRYRLVRG